MYNEDRKQQFIDERYKSESVKVQIRRIFKNTSDAEYSSGKDLCEFSADEVRVALSKSGYGGVRDHSVVQTFAAVSEYCEWCIARGITGVNEDLLNLRGAPSNALREKMVSGPTDLQSFLDEVFTPERKQGYDNVYRAYCWLAFLGFKEEDILELTIDDVSTVHGSIKFKGDVYPLYTAAVPCLSNCATLTEFIRPLHGHPVPVARVGGKQLLRGLHTEANLKGLKNELSRNIATARKEGRTDRRLSYFRIWLSGQYFRLYSREKIGDVIDFGAIARETIAERGTNYSKPVKALWFTTTQYEKDYKAWKETFNLR